MVNKQRKLKKEKPTPFEFLIHGTENNVLLRTSLKDFFLKIQEYPVRMN
jgi:hypothetical protein